MGPLAIAAGVAAELAIKDDYPGQLPWLAPVLIAVGSLAIVGLLVFSSRRTRIIAVSAAVGSLLLAPSVWAIDTPDDGWYGHPLTDGRVKIADNPLGPDAGLSQRAVRGQQTHIAGEEAIVVGQAQDGEVTAQRVEEGHLLKRAAMT